MKTTHEPLKSPFSYQFLIHVLFLVTLSGSALASLSVDEFLQPENHLDAAISPDGRHLAQIWNKGDQRILTISDISKDKTVITGSIIDNVVRALFVSWANNERVIVGVGIPYRTDHVRMLSTRKGFDIEDHFHFTRLVTVDVNAKNEVVLMEDQRRMLNNVMVSTIHHKLPAENDYILMSGFRGGAMSLFKVNVNTGESKKILSGTFNTIQFISDNDGNPKFRLDYFRHQNQIKIFRMLENNNWKLIDTIETNQDDEKKNLYQLVAVNDDGLIYRKRNDTTGFYQLDIYKFGAEQPESFISLQNKDVLYPVTEYGTDSIIGYAVDGDIIRNVFFDKKDQEKYNKLATLVGDYDFQVISKTKNNTLSIVKTEGANNPGTFWTYNEFENNLQILQHSSRHKTAKNLSFQAVADYKTRDGSLIHSYILFPQNFQKGVKYPLVVMPHGGPQYRDYADYDDFAQFISTRGYIVIKPNFRGSTGQGITHQEAGYKQWGQLMQDDVSDAVQFMIRKGYANPKKVCIAGISYGGYSALIGAIKTPELYRCSISINGVTDLPAIIKSDTKILKSKKLVKQYLHSRIGDPKFDKAMLLENSPINQVKKVGVPILLIGSTDDEIVPFEQQKKMNQALKNAKKSFEFIVLKDAPHNAFYFKKHRVMIYSEVEAFLKKYIGS